jgi:hypothetical protein
MVYAIGDVTPQGDYIRKHFGDARRPGEVLGIGAGTQSAAGLPAMIQPEVIAGGQEQFPHQRRFGNQAQSCRLGAQVIGDIPPPRRRSVSEIGKPCRYVSNGLIMLIGNLFGIAAVRGRGLGVRPVRSRFSHRVSFLQAGVCEPGRADRRMPP